ncbi:MAG: hypothetical protein J4G04_06260 [Nitrosopumilaceae archaeon]|nr:hypothetical protein [Nitrosopumilaceae archaeon]
MADIEDWNMAGWTTAEDGAGGFSISRDSKTVCARCGQPGPWSLRSLVNGELAHRDYAVCRCGEMLHAEFVWPDAPRPALSR